MEDGDLIILSYSSCLLQTPCSSDFLSECVIVYFTKHELLVAFIQHSVCG